MRAESIALCLALAASTCRADRTLPFNQPPELHAPAHAPTKLRLTVTPAPGLELLHQGLTEDTGQAYYARDRRIRLFRSRTAFAIQRDPADPRPDWQIRSFPDPNAMTAARSRVGALPPSVPRAEGILPSVPRAEGILPSVLPVFITEDTAAPLIVTDRFIAQLAPGATPADLSDLACRHNLKIIRHLYNAPDQFLLHAPGRSPDDLLDLANTFHLHPLTAWACPDFTFQLQLHYTPNDPLFFRQWHLQNTGQFNAAPDADLDATDLWDRTDLPRGGRPDIVVAIIDTGIQRHHPDLAANIFRNLAEYNGLPGVDDDSNGLVDDINGWDFYANDNNPNPGNVAHGTACAGLVAAREGNNLGGVGIAFNCSLLPVKISSDDGSFANSLVVAEAIRYAADMANVLSNSWGTGADDPIIHSAIQYAAITRKRLVFFAAGNQAAGAGPFSAWQRFGVTGFPAGTFTFRWQYSKDLSLSHGDDAVWLDDVTFPADPATESFEGPFPPPGWTSAGHQPWQPYDQSDHVRGTGCRSARSGHISHNQTTFLETTRPAGPGDLFFYAWISSEANYDQFAFQIQGLTYYLESGFPIVNYHVGFPAAYPEAIAVGASSDFDRRSEFSQFDCKNNRELDFTAPSNGGNAAITTTDLIGSSGYDLTSDYTTNFGGTSAACPLAAGLAALALSKNPNLDPNDLRTILRSSADQTGCQPYPDNYNPYLGHGRLNACAALAQTPSPADLNKDLQINLLDLAILLTHWLQPCPQPTSCQGADQNHDNQINLLDLTPLATQWLQPPLPCN